MTVADPRLLHLALCARLVAAVPTARIYDGEVGNLTTGTYEAVPEGSDGRVRPYVVVYSGTGTASRVALAGDHDDLDWGTQLTAVAGWQVDLLALTHRTRLALSGWRPTVAGASVGELYEVPTGAKTRRDPNVNPPRFYLPIEYACTATTT